MKKRSIIIALVFVFCAIVFSQENPVYAGFGLSPSHFSVSNLTKGAHIEKEIMLSRSDADEDLKVTVSFEGDTKDWLSTNYGAEFTIPSGTNRYPLTVMADIPDNIANGLYTGGVRLVSTKEGSKLDSAVNASISLTLLLSTEFTVIGDQVLDYKISSMQIHDVEMSEPLEVLLNVNNLGNVTARPTKVILEVYKTLNKDSIYQQEITDMGYVLPFTSGVIAFQVPHDLKLGQYWAKLSAYQDDELLEETTTSFEIKKIGELHKLGELQELSFNGEGLVGNPVEVIGVFTNIGERNYPATMQVDIYRGGTLLQSLESPTKLLTVNSTEKFSIDFVPERSGDHTIKAKVKYANEHTPEKEMQLVVKGTNTTPSSLVNTVIVGISVIALCSLAIFFLRKLRKRI